MTNGDAASPPQPLRFDSDDFPEKALAFERMRQLTAEICDVNAVGDLNDFFVASSTLHLSGALLLESRTSALRYDRTPQHVARGLDHFQLITYVGGGAEFIASDRGYVQRAGDVSLLDMRRPTLTREMQALDGYTHVVCFLLPRPLLAPMLAAHETRAAITILRRETPYAAMLRNFMLSLRRGALGLTHTESQSAVQALARLVAGGFSGGEAEPPLDDANHDAVRARIKMHVENNLGIASLGVESLCRDFNLSRAGLYRIFAPQSPMSYVQHRRLHRAFAMLLSPACRSWRVIDIALECQFASDATFIRAFRGQFGLSPGEARKLAEQKLLGAPPGAGASLPEPDAEAARWVSQLTGSMLQDAGL